MGLMQMSHRQIPHWPGEEGWRSWDWGEGMPWTWTRNWWSHDLDEDQHLQPGHHHHLPSHLLPTKPPLGKPWASTWLSATITCLPYNLIVHGRDYCMQSRHLFKCIILLFLKHLTNVVSGAVAKACQTKYLHFEIQTECFFGWKLKAFWNL